MVGTCLMNIYLTNHPRTCLTSIYSGMFVYLILEKPLENLCMSGYGARFTFVCMTNEILPDFMYVKTLKGAKSNMITVYGQS